MPLNKLDNFIKNTEGRILYVNPNDLDSTDSIENTGNSLARPFKTIQRALLESARFSYLRGSNNDIVEKTTILLFPGEYLIDNRPGYVIKKNNSTSPPTAESVSPSGLVESASSSLSLTLSSNFDLTSSDNILWKFNSVNGGVIIPRGTSLVGLDLRKTKIRPKYVPNPTDDNVPSSAIFRVTGACYFWQFSLFDANENSLVYTNNINFSTTNQSTPTFSHHKLTCFEYADGVNQVSGYDLTDLDMYYSKLTNAFNLASTRDIDQKYPVSPLGFAKQRPEWEIVGAFAADPIKITNIYSGDGITANEVVTVTTETSHGLSAGTPIKIKNVNIADYNISTKVQNVISSTSFTYQLPYVRNNLPAGSAGGVSAAAASVTIETDTVSGASPYIFNISMRSVWGMQGMHGDGAKASGFRSMVVAQFTAVSLQKDDRAFVKYNESSRVYEKIPYTVQTGSALASGSSSTSSNSVYHLDPDAIYRPGWETSHIKISNDAFIQIVSVFAIGFTQHFDCRNGGDGSITNSNSNFGQHSLSSRGFKKVSFDKDDKGYITSVITPRSIPTTEIPIDWFSIDVGVTTAVGLSSHLYIYGYKNFDDSPPVIVQGYRIGAREDDKLYVEVGSGTSEATIRMVDNVIGAGSTFAIGSNVSKKSFRVSSGPTSNVFTLDLPVGVSTHGIQTGEKVRVYSEDGDLPENIDGSTVYYAIYQSASSLKLAASRTNADNNSPITVYGGSKLTITSYVSDKSSGDLGSPVQWDPNIGQWFIYTNPSNQIYNAIQDPSIAKITIDEDTGAKRTNVSYVKRIDDVRSLDEKIYKLRYVIPKEQINAKDPTEGYVIQESSTTEARTGDFGLTSIGSSDYGYKRNLRFISSASVVGSAVSITSDLPHNLNVGDQIIVRNVTSSTNASATENVGYNGTFEVSTIIDANRFTHSIIDVNSVTHSPGTFTNDVNTRSTSLPRFERNDLKSNLYVYRSDVISPYIYGVQDGIYHLYVLNASNSVPTEFTTFNYGQNVTDLYPQLDRDNINDNPSSSVTFAKRSPLGEVNTDSLTNSITRETLDKFSKSFGFGAKIVGVTTTSPSGICTITVDKTHGFAGLATYSTFSGGSGYSNGTHYNVRLTNTNASGVWQGATATVTVSGGSVTSIDISAPGAGYTGGQILGIGTTGSSIGGGIGAGLTLTTAGISTNIGDVIQVTGIGTTSDGYYRVLTVPSATTVAISRTTGDPVPQIGQYLFNISPSARVSTVGYSTVTGITTINCSSPHGLVAGNRFRLIDINNNNLGDYIVKENVGILTFTTHTPVNPPTSAAWVLKHGYSANNASSDVAGENLAMRGVSIYDNDYLILQSNILLETTLPVSLPSSGIGTTKRFALGDYIQVDSEIMRITSSTLTGSSNNEISVLRGVFGTLREHHQSGSIIKKISPLAIELRRPSIVRASGHTFEYLGYGPGNYSTSLPQVQLKSLTEKETFLAQSQEKSCGTVVYTGMNNDGDFFIGNTKYSSASGKQTTFDIPIPTVVGQDPSRSSVVFDEVVIKERIRVEGGTSSNILSQFDGPVTFSNEVKFQDNSTFNDSVKFNETVLVSNTAESTSKDTGSVVLEGGMGIEKNLSIGGNVNVTGNTNINGITTISNTTQSINKDTGSLIIEGGLGVEKNVNIGGTLAVTGISTFTGDSQFLSNLNVSGSTFVNALNINTTGAAQGDVYSNGGGDGVFGIYNTSNSGEINFNVKNSVGVNTAVLRLVNSSAQVNGNLNVTGDITAFYTSDQRLKDNIIPIPDALEKIISISGNTYHWNDKSDKRGSDVGVIAQEILKILPEAVITRDNGYFAVDYQKLIPLVIEAIKELKSEIDDLKKTN